MTTCHLCDEELERGIVVNTIARHDEPQTSVACARCGLVQVAPMPSQQELGEYYSSGEYRRKFPWAPLHGADGEVYEYGSQEYDRLMDEASRRYVQRVVDTIGRTPAEVWEWGCGDGRLLAAFKAMGADVVGIEPDVALREKLASRGIATYPLHKRPLTELAMAVHVLEHMSDPLGRLQLMRQSLVPGGHVWIEVPNLAKPYGPLTHFFQWPHLYNFTSGTLACLLIRAGFDDVFVAEQGHVIMAHASRGEGERRSFDEAVSRMHAPMLDGQVVAEMLAEYTRQESVSPGAKLNRWLKARGDSDDWLRDEFELMEEAITVTLHSLGKMSEDLDALVTEDTWHHEPWVLAYHCGVKEMAQRAQVAVTHLANNIAARATR